MQTIIEILGLQKPVQVTISKRAHKYWDAEYEPEFTDRGRIKRHKIVIYKNSERDPESLLAHELIHAWQAENNIADIHGKPFQQMAKKIQKKHPNLKMVYIKGVDI